VWKRELAVGARIAFVSSNRSWGGSEELWAATAGSLAAAGHAVSVFKTGLPRRHPRIERLRALSCRLVELGIATGLSARFPLLAAVRSSKLAIAFDAAMLWLRLLVGRRPDLVVLSQGGNHDGWPLAAVCRRLRLPYVCICHKATDLYWPSDRWRDRVRTAFEDARWCYFVSEHTLRLTEEQFGRAIPNASLVRNPFNVPWDRPQPWPSSVDGFRLGCIGRLNVNEKGQDVLLRVLASEKWRSRPVAVTFLGEGEQRLGLEQMAGYLGLSNVTFAGRSDDVAGFWADHHALVLPSRAEGLPLVLVEALLCGRTAIVTDVGGNSEFVEDGVTGFIAAAPTEKSLDETLERAWSRRGEWAALGAAAAAYARTLVPADPAKLFAEILLEQATANGPAWQRSKPSRRRIRRRNAKARTSTTAPS
jgi:glycosyltransferase involved in cell wall biosynthesis